MAILRGFPPSNTISPGVRIAESDQSFISPDQSFHRAGLVGFASKGPINVPTLIQTTRQLHTTFGYAHPASGDPYMIYAAEQYLLVANELYIVRVADTDAVSDERATLASADIPVAGGDVIIQSNTAGPYIFDTDSFFKWKLNGVLASKTLHVPANDGTTPNYSCAALVNLLNDQLTPAVDGIEFFSGTGSKIGVRTTFSFGPDASIELVSVLNAIYGPKNGSTAPGFSGIAGLGVNMTQASSTSSEDGYSTGYVTPGTWDFTSQTDLQLLLVVDGTDHPLIDNVVQTIDLADLEGLSNSTADIVNEINSQITAGTIVGGFYAVGGGVTSGPTIDTITLDISAHPLANADNLTLVTLHHGKDARLLVKSESTAFDIFAFNGLTAVGTSPAGVSGDTDTQNDGIVTGDVVSSTDSFSLTADSPGIEGNNTQVVITNDVREAVFTIDVYSNGVTVESWGNLTKDQASNHYVATYLALASDFIRCVDNTSTSANPKNGTYDLAGGRDGIPSDPDKQDQLLIGNDIGQTGMFALSEPEQIDIDIIACPGHSSTTVVTELISVCADYRQDALAIIDPPFGLTVQEIIHWQNGVHPLNTVRLDSDFAALYWPWVKIRDNFNGLDVWVPPSGSIMAVYARNDQLAAPWFAPAGVTRGQVPGISDVFSRPTLAERDLMYGNRNAINPIVQFTDLTGFLVWGQKTLQRLPTALDRVNVRRLMFTAEKRIRAASRQLLFDPNDELFQARFVSLATGILREIQVGRGITAFAILADSTLNTPDVVDRNEFRARIGIQPTRAAEFIFIEFSVNRTGSFADSTGGF
jgi:hypothetical protein